MNEPSNPALLGQAILDAIREAVKEALREVGANGKPQELLAPEELAKALTLEMAGKLTAIFKGLGFQYVALDLEGYRQGSLNEVLDIKPARHA